jgi:hypothetical protein
MKQFVQKSFFVKKVHAIVNGNNEGYEEKSLTNVNVRKNEAKNTDKGFGKSDFAWNTDPKNSKITRMCDFVTRKFLYLDLIQIQIQETCSAARSMTNLLCSSA